MPEHPHETIWALATATVVSRTLHVIADLGVADHIGDGPASSKDLARLCGADPDALHRSLLLLAAHGVFQYEGDGFAHNASSRLLRSDHPMSMRAFPRMMGMASFSASFAELGHSVRTGAPAFELVDSDGLFGYLQRHPEEASIFGESMTAKSAADIAAVLATCDFNRFSTIADVGGGRGHLLEAVLDAAPRAEGILFDLPEVIATVDIASERLSLAPGDFFADPLPAADAYVLMEIIHDWDDAQAVEILSAVRRAAAAESTVLIIEAVAHESHLDPGVQTLDMIMLAITGGRERTSGQLERLLSTAGFALVTVLDTPGSLRIVEALAV